MPQIYNPNAYPMQDFLPPPMAMPPMMPQQPMQMPGRPSLPQPEMSGRDRRGQALLSMLKGQPQQGFGANLGQGLIMGLQGGGILPRPSQLRGSELSLAEQEGKIQEIEAAINLKKAQAGYYDAQAEMLPQKNVYSADYDDARTDAQRALARQRTAAGDRTYGRLPHEVDVLDSQADRNRASEGYSDERSETERTLRHPRELELGARTRRSESQADLYDERADTEDAKRLPTVDAIMQQAYQRAMSGDYSAARTETEDAMRAPKVDLTKAQTGAANARAEASRTSKTGADPMRAALIKEQTDIKAQIRQLAGVDEIKGVDVPKRLSELTERLSAVTRQIQESQPTARVITAPGAEEVPFEKGSEPGKPAPSPGANDKEHGELLARAKQKYPGMDDAKLNALVDKYLASRE